MARHIFAVAATALLFAGAPVLAQSTEQAGSSNPAIKDSDPAKLKAPAKGANSFTEDQARKRLAKAGYTVSSLTKNDDGVWMGAVTKGGKAMNVGLDYKGNITTR